MHVLISEFVSSQKKDEGADDNNDETFGEGAVGPSDGGLGGIGLGGLRVSSTSTRMLDAAYV